MEERSFLGEEVEVVKRIHFCGGVTSGGKEVSSV